MVDGDLKTFLQKKNAQIPTSHLIGIATQIASAMIYITSNPHRIVHRELAAQNVLVNGVTENGTPLVKVSGFSLARQLDACEELYTEKPPSPLMIRWAAPEVIQKLEFSLKSDVWAFGMLLYEIMSMGGKLFAGFQTMQVCNLLTKFHEHFPMPKPFDCPETIYDLMHFCWEIDPNRRPTFEQIDGILNNLDDPKKMQDYLSSKGIEGLPIYHGLSNTVLFTDSSIFEISARLPNGHFSQVKKARNKEDNSEVAIKVMFNGKGIYSNFLREAEILADLRHENLVKLVGLCEINSGTPWIITELMSGGNVKKFLMAGDAESIPISHLRSIAEQVASAMLYMSSQRIIHRDLANRNIFIASVSGDNNGPLVKVAGLGLARQLELGQDYYMPTEYRPFAPRWAAPEVLQTFTYSIKSDIWAFGMVLYEIMSRGRLPFPDCERLGEIWNRVLYVNHENFPMPKPQDCPQTIFHLMHFCWSRDPKDRPNFDKIVDILNGNDHETENPAIGPSSYPVADASSFALDSIVLGKGHFSRVQLAINQKDNSKVAVKIKRYVFHQGPENFLREAELLSQCDHPNILKLIGVAKIDTPEPWIITEYMADGNLNTFLLDRKSEIIPSSHLISIAAQVASALQYMTSSPRNIIHCDLAARNILVDGSTEDGAPLVKVADLGLARRLDHAGNTGCKIYIRRAAPEVLINFNFSDKSDVWAFGMLLYEIMTWGENPFPGLPNEQIKLMVVNGCHNNFPMPNPSDCPDALFDLMHLCWRKDPRNRPAFEDILCTVNNLYYTLF